MIFFIRNLCVLVAITLHSFNVFAGINEYTNTKKGALISSGAIVTAMDERYNLMLLNGSNLGGQYELRSIENYVTLSFSGAERMYFEGIVKVGFDAYITTLDINDQPVVNIEHGEVEVVLSHLTSSNLANFSPKNISIWKPKSIQPGYKLEVIITDVSTPVIYNDIVIEAKVISDGFYINMVDDDGAAVQPYDPMHIENASTSSAINDATVVYANKVSLVWPFVEGAEEYEVEYVFWDKYSTYGGKTIGYTFSSSSQAGDFVEELFINATRINTSNNFYNVDLPYEDGWFMYRIRPVTYFQQTGFTLKQYGTWSSCYTGNNLKNYFELKTIPLTISEDKNWTFSRSFAEDGKSKGVLSFFDKTGRGRQSVTKNNTDDVAIVSDIEYDYDGRAVANFIPAPIDDNRFVFYNDVNTSENILYGFNETFKSYNFSDKNSTAINYREQSTLSGIGRYYSSNNDFQQNSNVYIPDADKYGYVQNVFDDQGRPKYSSGVGFTHRIASNHITSNIYGVPTPESLYRLFGNDIGKAEHYSFSITKDPNGQFSKSYYNLAGKVIATSLVGAVPTEGGQLMVDDIYEGTPPTITEHFESFNRFDEGKMQNEISYEFPVVDLNTDFDFEYNFTPASYNPCENFDCKYDLVIQILNDKDNPLVLNYTVGTDAAKQDTIIKLFALSPTYHGSLPIKFTVQFATAGSYRIIKKLVLSEEALGVSVADYSQKIRNPESPCYINVPDNFPIDECVCLESCAEKCKCEAQQINGDFTGSDGTAVHTAYLYYTACMEECEGPVTDNNCDAMLDLMKIDMSPGGQYWKTAKPSSLSNPNYPNSGGGFIWIFSKVPSDIDNSSNAYYNSGDSKYYAYYDHLVELPLVNNDGTIESIFEDFADWDEVEDAWETEYADFLVTYHPEYCHYLACVNHSNVIDYPELISLTNTYVQAQSNNFIDGSGNLNISAVDPIFLSSFPCISSVKAAFTTITNNIWTSAVSAAAGNNDMKWAIFRGHYLDARKKIVELCISDPQLCSSSDASPTDLCRNDCNYLEPENTDYLQKGEAPKTSEGYTIRFPKGPDGDADQPNDPGITYGYTTEQADELTNHWLEVADDIKSVYKLCDRSRTGFTFKSPVTSALSAACSSSCGEVQMKIYYDGSWHAISDYFGSIPGSYNPCEHLSSLDHSQKPLQEQLDNFNAFAEMINNYVSQSVPRNPPIIATVGVYGSKAILYLEFISPFLPVYGTENGIDFTRIIFSSCDCPSGEGEGCAANMAFLPIQHRECLEVNYPHCFCGQLREGYYVYNENEEILQDEDNGGYATAEDYVAHELNVYYKEKTGEDPSPLITAAKVAAWHENCELTRYISHVPNAPTQQSPVKNIATGVETPLPAALDCSIPDVDCEKEASVPKNFFYGDYRDKIYADAIEAFRVNMIRHCLDSANVNEVFKVSHVSREHHFTLYYYEPSGNLIRTVPPAGVLPLTETQVTSAAAYANSGTGSPVYPDHRMITNYKYDSYSSVVLQNTPDAGTSEFYYDKLGRVIFSQNAEQRQQSLAITPHSLASYTRYDNLGRISDAGEVELNNLMPSRLTGTGSSLFITILQGNNPVVQMHTLGAVGYADRVVTHYDNGILPWQKNLRNRVAYVEALNGNSGTTTSSTYYSYDFHGSVTRADNTYGTWYPATETKTVRYKYDLVSGNVNEVMYQPGQADQFYHRYLYDADNRITHVFTSSDYHIWDMDAKYFYYPHGPLARVEYGSAKVQGIDYAYTIHGWLKGINSTHADYRVDMGHDGTIEATNTHTNMGRDAFASSLGYYYGDYKPVGNATLTGNTQPFAFTYNSSLLSTTSNLYNGNITHSTNAFLKGTFSDNVIGYSYRYDQLNRLKRQFTYTNVLSPLVPGVGNSWLITGGAATASTNKWYMGLTYDANGNIMTLDRNGHDGANLAMDALNYKYEYNGTRLANNKLRFVGEAVNITSDPYAGDIKYIDESTYNPADANTDNYVYDAIGNLIVDKKEGLVINWNNFGKIERITKAGVYTIDFAYDATGNRISKIYQPTGADATGYRYTFYTRDASGNVMATYHKDGYTVCEAEEEGGYFSANTAEYPIYGSSRVGVYERNLLAIGSCQQVAAKVGDFEHWPGERKYEVSNHLGNVMAVISARKIGMRASTLTNVIDYFEPEILSAQDYYPFGMHMEGRFRNTPAYRYGFNGMEKDDEVKGVEGSSLDFGARIYDPRLGRWLAVDMATKSTPEWTPYRYGFDNPLRYKDPNGAWEEDGHFWTVYAMGIAMGIPKATARDLAVRAEFYDHYVLLDNKMLIHPHKSGISWGKDGGLGTWADPVLQEDQHGLTGGPQEPVLLDALTRVLLGDMDQLHKVGDAWAHSYIDQNGKRVMYGQHGRDEPLYAPLMRLFLGDITFEHAKGGPKSGRYADDISKRPVEYINYIYALKELYNTSTFKYNKYINNENPNMGIFTYVQQYGGSKENNIFLFQSYIALEGGQHSFYGLNDEKARLFEGYLTQEKKQYETSKDCGKTNIYICP